MKVTYRLSKKSKRLSGSVTVFEVMARLHTGDIDQYAKTGVFVPQSFTDKNGNKKVTWDNGIIIPKISYADEEAIKVKELLTEAKKRLQEIDMEVVKAYDALTMRRQKPQKGWLQKEVDGCSPTQPQDERHGVKLLDAYNKYITSDNIKIAEGTFKHYRTILYTLERYEAERRTTLYLDDITADTLRDIARFIKAEDPDHRSDNYIITLMRKFRTFIRWANGLSKKWPIDPLTRNNPFDRYAIGSEQYGTPFYLTIEERNKLADFDLPPRLSIQRDIFVFQCLIGCRLSDFHLLNFVLCGFLFHIISIFAVD